MKKMYLAIFILLFSACSTKPTMETVLTEAFRQNIIGDYKLHSAGTSSMLGSLGASFTDKAPVKISDLDFTIPTSVSGKNISFKYIKMLNEFGTWFAYEVTYEGTKKYASLTAGNNKSLIMHGPGLTDSVDTLPHHSFMGVNILTQ